MHFFLHTFSGKAKTAFALFLFLILGTGATSAETIEETFEDVTIVDADGNPLASSWASGSGLSNGWRIIGGTLYANDNGDYGLIHATGQGFGMSDYYFTSASTSVNSAYVFIPAPLQGEVLIWARSNLSEKSKKSSSLKVYEATADGTVETGTLLYEATPEKGVTTWKPFQFTIDSEGGKYIALNLVYTDIDDFTATIADGTTVTAELTVSTEAIDFGTVSEEATQTFNVKSNVTTSVSFTLTGTGADVFEVTDAPATLAAGEQNTVSVKMNASEPGDYEATLVVTAGELTKNITLTGTWEEKNDDPDTPSDWVGEDFTGLDNIPAEWTIGDGADWTIDDRWLDTAPALKGFSGEIITPMFTIGGDQGMEFYFQKSMSFDWSSKCIVSYSTDKTDWTVAETYDQYSDDGTKTITFPEPGNYYLQLSVNAIAYFDDFRIVELTATGINQIENSKLSNSKYSDLLGRQLSNSKWSNSQIRNGQIIIVDGKKILRK